jgi:hypothetical protein
MYRVLLVPVLGAFVDGDPKDEQDKSGIISHLARELHGQPGFFDKIPAKHKRNNLVGAGIGPEVDVEAELRAIRENRGSVHTQGCLYNRPYGTEYDENEILVRGKIWFWRPLTREVNDCSVHTFNLTCGHPVFTLREQVHTLYLQRNHKSHQQKDASKIEGGYHLSVFNDFIVKGNRTFYMKKVKTFIQDRLSFNRQVKQYIENEMMGQFSIVQELIFVGDFVFEN